VRTPPTPPGMTRGERAQEGTQFLFVGRGTRRIQSLRGTTLTNDDAGSALRHPELLFECNDHSTAAVRGQNFPSATNFNMSMSRAWFATMRFNWVFSFSSSFSRLASLAFMPPY